MLRFRGVFMNLALKKDDNKVFWTQWLQDIDYDQYDWNIADLQNDSTNYLISTLHLQKARTPQRN